MREMSRELNLSPFVHDSHTFLQAGRFFSKEKGTALLFSGGDFPLSQKSFLCLFPFEFISLSAEVQHKFYNNQQGIQLNQNPWDALKTFLGAQSACDLPHWVGYLSYEMGAFSDPLLTLEHTLPDVPLAYFQHFAVVIVFNHFSRSCYLYSDRSAMGHLNEYDRRWFTRTCVLSEWESILQEAEQAPQNNEKENLLHLSHPLKDGLEYISQVLKAKELIYDGEIYQANLSKQFTIEGKCHPFAIFQKLLSCNPAPYMCYMDLPCCTLISTSPEQFLKKEGSHLSTEPIKGTFPRGKNSAEDVQNRNLLLASPKENAELLMITDLMRNDLGKISSTGSVEGYLAGMCHAYQNVFHLSSPLRSKIKPAMHYVDALRSCFPGGSITGCPKIRAMQVIHELEKRSRGPYTGSIGYFAQSGNFDFNIAIRTLVITGDKISVSLGAGIVADSDPEKEFQEILHKGESIFHVLGVASDIICSNNIQNVIQNVNGVQNVNDV